MRPFNISAPLPTGTVTSSKQAMRDIVALRKSSETFSRHLAA